MDPRNGFFGLDADTVDTVDTVDLDAAALPLHGNPLFCRSGNKLTNAGIAPSCTEESRAHAVEFYSAARIEPRRNSHKNTLDFTLTEVEQKEAGG